MTPDALWAIVYGLGLVIFVNRYVAGLLVRAIRGRSWDETRDDFEPRVTAVVPMFNEGAAIAATLRSVLASTYPAAKLRVVCVDDGSTDDSYARACAVAAAAGDRLTVLRNPVNQGKRRSLIRAVRAADGELVVSQEAGGGYHPAICSASASRPSRAATPTGSPCRPTCSRRCWHSRRRDRRGGSIVKRMIEL